MEETINLCKKCTHYYELEYTIDGNNGRYNQTGCGKLNLIGVQALKCSVFNSKHAQVGLAEFTHYSEQEKEETITFNKQDIITLITNNK